MFIKFIYNACVCKCHCFTWSYQPVNYIRIKIFALTNIEPLFHFWTTKNFWKLYGVMKFSGGEKTEHWCNIGYKLISCCEAIVLQCAIFYLLKTSEKFIVFGSFQGEKWNIGLIRDKSVSHKFQLLWAFQCLLMECSCESSNKYCGSGKNNPSVVQYMLWKLITCLCHVSCGRFFCSCLLKL